MAITTNGKVSITNLQVGSSADLAGIISDESGTGVLAFTTSPTFTTPTLGTASATAIELGHASDTTLSRSSAGVLAVEGTAVLLSGGALGTPSSGTLTNATGLPVSGITASTSTALGVGSIELGHATDTTIARASSGVVTIEGSTILVSGGALGTPASGTLTNATGLPISGLTASTSTALGVGSIELGHATDTTIARASSGVVSIEGNAVLVSGGALGTPASGTLTNATGLPVSGITASTSTALGVGSVELGHATDTTLARVSAGVVSIEGVNVVTTSSTDTLTNKTLTSPAINTATFKDGVVRGLEEDVNVVASAATGTINFEVDTASIWYYTSNATANHTLNFRYSSSVSLNTALAVGDAITLVWMNTNGTTAYYPSAFQIDGNSVTPKVPAAITGGNASAIDVYAFTIIKTASATFTVLETQQKFA